MSSSTCPRDSVPVPGCAMPSAWRPWGSPQAHSIPARCSSRHPSAYGPDLLICATFLLKDFSSSPKLLTLPLKSFIVWLPVSFQARSSNETLLLPASAAMLFFTHADTSSVLPGHLPITICWNPIHPSKPFSDASSKKPLSTPQ